MPDGRRVLLHVTTRQDNDDDDDVRDVRDEVRHAPERNYFLFPRVYVSRRTRRPDTDGTERTRTDDGTRLRGSSRTTPGPNRWLDGYPTDPRVLSSSSFIFSFLSRGYNYPRFNRQLLGVDRASPTPTTRRMVGLTRVNPSLFSLDAALSPPGRPTVKVRRMPIRDVATRGFCTREKRPRIASFSVRAFARSRVDSAGVSSMTSGGCAADPSFDGWGCTVSWDVIDGS